MAFDPLFILGFVFSLGFLFSLSIVMTVFAVTHLSKKDIKKATIFVIIGAALFTLFAALAIWLFIFYIGL